MRDVLLFLMRMVLLWLGGVIIVWSMGPMIAYAMLYSMAGDLGQVDPRPLTEIAKINLIGGAQLALGLFLVRTGLR